MKRIFRIAPLLIVLALGIKSIPGAQALSCDEDTTNNFRQKTEKSSFKGIWISPNPIDQLWLDASSSKTGAKENAPKENCNQQTEKSKKAGFTKTSIKETQEKKYENSCCMINFTMLQRL